MLAKLPFQEYTPDTAPFYAEGMQTATNCLPYLALPNYSQSPSLALSTIGNINGSSYTANAVDNGSTAYLSKGTALTVSDGKAGALSIWLRFDGGTFGVISKFGSTLGFFQLNWKSTGVINVLGYNSAGTKIMDFESSATFSPGNTWYNVLIAWDLAAGNKLVYVNNTSSLGTVTTFTNDTIDYTGTGNNIWSDNAGGQRFDGCIAEYWWNSAYLDFSSAPNRAKFISSGFPVSLGSTGQTPTGSSPIIYLKSAAASAGTNSGTGGDFTVNGVFSVASSSPSDSTPTQYLGAISAIDSTGANHIYAGTSNKIAEITASTANDLSKAGGYTCTTFWKAAQFTKTDGTNIVVFTDYADPIQSMTVGGTVFADLASAAPKAKAIAQVGQFIMVGNTSGGTYNSGTAGAVPNRIWTCAIGNPTSWLDALTSAGIAAQTFVQDLPAVYGEVRHITNGQFFGLAFQEHAITNLTYVGGNVVFQVNTYEKQRGLYCANGACQVGGLVYFPDSSGFYVTDGSTTVPIGHDQVDKTWLADVNTAYLDHVRASYDSSNKCVWWSYPSVSSTLTGGFVTCDKVIVYNIEDKRWGMGYTGQTIDIIFDGHTLGYTMEQLDAFGTMDTITPSLDSPYWNGGLPIVGAFGIGPIGASSSYASYYGTFTGAALDATLVTKEMQLNDGGRALVIAAAPIVMGATLGNISIYPVTRNLLTDSQTTGNAYTPNTRTGKCNFRSESRYHAFQMKITGGFTNAMGIEPEFTQSGAA